MRYTFSRPAGLATRLTLVVASFALIGVVPAGATTTSISTLRCGSDALSVIWRGTTGGLAGTFGELFWIRNEGSISCVVSGFPTISFYKDGERLAIKAVDYIGHEGNDQMGVADRRRPPTVRLAPGATASFWIFGTDVVTPCLNPSGIVVSLRSLTGWAEVSVPASYQSWPYCGDAVTVNPIVPGVSGSDPARPLHTEIEHL